ncbi:hypothetical protein IV38_GL001258 [Lactobacillus selangorensis]|uniref:Uncharacterized protein n=1 Tax=Lactobacillus selangorensis TaxID=81857 RepID=A0A0R2FK85_9LACO|nr:hypothetical protein [Lactobacillus selangorensis]KRN29042.1 hypothetical protein IV38_GL001258 [Lactobacillus selangorensis]
MKQVKKIHVGADQHDFSSVIGKIEHEQGFTEVRKHFDHLVQKKTQVQDQQLVHEDLD